MAPDKDSIVYQSSVKKNVSEFCVAIFGTFSSRFFLSCILVWISEFFVSQPGMLFMLHKSAGLGTRIEKSEDAPFKKMVHHLTNVL